MDFSDAKRVGDHSGSIGSECHMESPHLWRRLQELVAEWISAYEQTGVILCRMREALLEERLVELTGHIVKESPALQEPIPTTWLVQNNVAKSEHELILKSAINRMEQGLSMIRQSEKQSETKFVNGLVQANVNGICVNLQFKNSGNNDINDIETYLQEKLDVLEFIQMDCNKMEMSQFPTSRLPRSDKRGAPQLDQSSVSVADWYTAEKQSIHISQGDSFIESVHVPSQRSHLKELADDGFFIGTPTAREQILLDQSNLDWETSSVLSYSSRRGGHKKSSSSSRNRSLSSCSISSVDESRNKPPVAPGMFGRGRMARMAANLSGYNDENDDVVRPSQTSWWESGY